jgi:hypothetical protein
LLYQGACAPAGPPAPSCAAFVGCPARR